MQKRILLIVIILILVVGGIIGIWYFKSSDNQLSQNENNNFSNSMPENLVEPIQNDTNTISDDASNVLNESVNITSEGNSNTKNEENNTKLEVNTVTQENKKSITTPTSTESKSNSSNSNIQKTQTKEKSEQTTSTNTTSSISTSTSTEKSDDDKKDTTQTNKVERCTNNHNHGMDVGNSGKWFNTKAEAIAFYDEKINYWGNLWENFEIEDDEYYKNCPTGYEYYSCMYCSKWTINLYYR